MMILQVAKQPLLATDAAEGRGGLPRDIREAARMWRMAADWGQHGSAEQPSQAGRQPLNTRVAATAGAIR